MLSGGGFADAGNDICTLDRYLELMAKLLTTTTTTTTSDFRGRSVAR